MDLEKRLKDLSAAQLKKLIEKRHSDHAEQKYPVIENRIGLNHPLSSAQMRIWTQSQIEDQKALFNIPLVIKFETEHQIIPEIWEKSLEKLVQTHECFKTKFIIHEGIPKQIIKETGESRFYYHDFRTNLTPTEVVLKQIEKEASFPFDLEKGPLMKLFLYRISQNQYIFFLLTHHIISDGWSNTLFFQELTQLYFQLSQGIDRNPSPNKLQYLDYVYWEKNKLSESYIEKNAIFWEKKLQVPITRFHLPFRQNLRSASSEGSLETLELPTKLCNKLKKFSQEQKVTLFSTLVSGLYSLINKYCGERDLIIGLPYANRNIQEFQNTLGVFVNTLPFRKRLNPNQSFKDLVKEISKEAAEYFEHGDFPFEKIVEKIKPEREKGFHPFFHIAFTHQNIPNAYKIPGIDVSPFPVNQIISQFDLSIWVEEYSDKLLISARYRKDLYFEKNILRFLKDYQTTLNSQVESPDMSLSQLTLLNEKEKEQLIQKCRSKSKKRKKETFLDSFLLQVKEKPDAIALGFYPNNISYKSLHIRSNQYANFLSSLGIKQGDIVAVCMDRSSRFVSALLGILKLGAAILPIDPYQPKKRIQYLLEDSKTTALLSETTFSELVSEINIRQFLVDEKESILAEHDKDCSLLKIEPSSLSYIIYTSGSTGLPKGIAVEYQQLSSYLDDIHTSLKEFQCKTFLHASTIGTDLGYTSIFYPLSIGMTICLLPDKIAKDPTGLSNFISKWPFDFLKLVPSQLQFYLNEVNNSILPQKCLMLAGESTPIDLIKKLRSNKPEMNIFLSYGPTETTIGVLTKKVNESDLKLGMLGQPQVGASAFILDDAMNLLPQGFVGELYIGGNRVARGYHNTPRLTAERFLPDPYSHIPGSRIYRTGDLSALTEQDDFLFHGRKDSQVKIRGFRVELEEIEKAILQHPKVSNAHVLFSNEQLCAYLLTDERETVEKSILNFLNQRLPSYMIPSKIYFCDQFPIRSNGKVDIEKLKKESRPIPKNKILDPKNSIEKQLVQIWKNTLQVDSLSTTDNFFDLGGHSFLAVKMLNLIKNEVGITLPIHSLIEYPTIEELGKLISQKKNYISEKVLIYLNGEKKKGEFIFVHPAGGQVMSYIPLAKSLREEYRFYALQVPKITEKIVKHHHSIIEIAASYLKQVNLGEDPLPILGGWSMGATIAYEMANQIIRKTGKLLPIILIDQPTPNVSAKSHEAKNPLYRFLEKVIIFANINIRINEEDFIKMEATDQAYFVYHIFLNHNQLPERTSFEDFCQFIELQKAHTNASSLYTPEKFPGKTLLIRGKQSHQDSPTLGWDKYIKDLDIEWVSGNHITMMRESNLKEIADAIRKHHTK